MQYEYVACCCTMSVTGSFPWKVHKAIGMYKLGGEHFSPALEGYVDIH